jgi:hypothetical protein
MGSEKRGNVRVVEQRREKGAEERREREAGRERGREREREELDDDKGKGST